MILQYIRTRSDFNAITRQRHRGEHGAAISKGFRHSNEDARLFRDVNKNCDYPDVLGDYLNDKDSILRIIHPPNTDKTTVIIRNFRVYDMITDRKSEVPYSHAYILTEKEHKSFLNNPQPAFDYNNFMLYPDFVEREKSNKSAPGDVDIEYGNRFLASSSLFSFDIFKEAGFNETLFCSLIDCIIEVIEFGGNVAVLLPEENKLSTAENIMLGIIKLLPKTLRKKFNAISCWVKKSSDEYHMYFPTEIDEAERAELLRDGVFIIDLIQGESSINSRSKFSELLWDSLEFSDKINRFDELSDFLTSNNYDFNINKNNIDAFYEILTKIKCVNNKIVFIESKHGFSIMKALISLFEGSFGQYPEVQKLFISCIKVSDSDEPGILEYFDEGFFGLLAKEHPVNDKFREFSSTLVKYLSWRFAEDKLPAEFLDKFVKLIVKKPTLDYEPLKKYIPIMEIRSVNQVGFLSKIFDSEKLKSSFYDLVKEKMLKTISEPNNELDSAVRSSIRVMLFSSLGQEINNPKVPNDKLISNYSTLIQGLLGDDESCFQRITEIFDMHLRKLVAFDKRGNSDRAKTFYDEFSPIAYEKINSNTFEDKVSRLLRYIYLFYTFFQNFERDILTLYDFCVDNKGIGFDNNEIDEFKTLIEDSAWDKYKETFIKRLSQFEMQNLNKRNNAEMNYRSNFFFDKLRSIFSIEKAIDNPSFDLLILYWEKYDNSMKHEYLNKCLKDVELGYWFYAEISKKHALDQRDTNVLDKSNNGQKRLIKVAKANPSLSEPLYKLYQKICMDECESGGHFKSYFLEEKDWDYVTDKRKIEKMKIEKMKSHFEKQYSVLIIAFESMMELLNPNRVNEKDDGIELLSGIDSRVLEKAQSYLKKLSNSTYNELENCLECIVLVDESLTRDRFTRPKYNITSQHTKVNASNSCIIMAGRFHQMMNKEKGLSIEIRCLMSLEITILLNSAKGILQDFFEVNEFIRRTAEESQVLTSNEALYRCLILISKTEKGYLSSLKKNVLFVCAEKVLSLIKDNNVDADYILNGEKGEIAQGLRHMIHRLGEYGQEGIKLRDKICYAIRDKEHGLLRDLKISINPNHNHNHDGRTSSQINMNFYINEEVENSQVNQPILIFVNEEKIGMQNIFKTVSSSFFIIYLAIMWFWVLQSTQIAFVNYRNPSFSELLSIVAIFLGSVVIIPQIIINVADIVKSKKK